MSEELHSEGLDEREKELMEFISLSEPVFAEAWNSPEEDVWDEF